MYRAFFVVWAARR